MPKQRGWQQGDICYQTGLNWRSLIHLVRPKTGKAGHYLTEVKLIFKPDHVLVLLKKDSPKGPQVAFIEAENFDQAMWAVSQQVKAKKVKWHADKFRSIRSDKK